MLDIFSITTSLQPMAIVGIILASLTSFGTLAVGFGYLWSRFASGRSQADIEDEQRKERVDKTLTELVDAQDKRFQIIEADHRLNLEKIGKLQGIIEQQTKQQEWFEGIFISALDKFFKDNPELAINLNGKLNRHKIKR